MNLSVFLGYSFVSIIAVEALTEYFAGRLVEKIEALQKYAWLMAYLSAGVGIFLAFWFQLNAAFALAGLGVANDPVGIVITGAILGRGGNGLNTLFDWLQGAYQKYILKVE